MKKSAPFYHGGTLAWGEVKLPPPSHFPIYERGRIPDGDKRGAEGWLYVLGASVVVVGGGGGRGALKHKKERFTRL